MRDVIVVGAGPVGMLVAAELTRRGVDVAVLERRGQAGAGSRAIGVHSPVLAALEPSGLTDGLLAEAVRVPRGEARSGGRLLGVVRFDRLRSRFPFVATLPQEATERILAAAAPEPVRGDDVVSIRRHAGRAVVRTAGGLEHAARVVVVAAGAGARALVYRAAGERVHSYPDRYLMADAAAPSAPRDVAVVHLDETGVLESFPLPGGLRRFVAWDAPGSDPDDSARVGRLRDAIRARDGEDAAAGVTRVSAFGVRRFVAERMRNGRIVVVGDAAHEVSPIGGQGMNLGLLDAVGLAPLLTEWTRTGTAPERELRAWERRRLASARTAARLAAANTMLGRRLGGTADAARRSGVRAMLAPPLGAVFARAYAMGFDRGA